MLFRSTSPHPPSLFVEQLGHFPVTPKPNTLALTSLHSLDNNKQRDTAVPHAASDSTQVLTTTKQIQQYIPDVDAAPQISEESANLPRSIVSGSLPSSPVSIPALHSDAIPAEPPSSIESALVRPNNASPQIGSPPSDLRTVRPYITPQVASVLDLHVTAAISAALEHDQLRDTDSPISMGLSLHTHRPVPSIPDITEDVLPAVGHQDDRN